MLVLDCLDSAILSSRKFHKRNKARLVDSFPLSRCVTNIHSLCEIHTLNRTINAVQSIFTGDIFVHFDLCYFLPIDISAAALTTVLFANMFLFYAEKMLTCLKTVILARRFLPIFKLFWRCLFCALASLVDFYSEHLILPI